MSLIADDLQTQLVAAYAAGALDRPLRLLVETQAELRADCAEAIEIADIVAAQAFENETPVAMGASALDMVFARIEAGPEPLSVTHRKAAQLAGAAMDEILKLPASVRDVALQALETQSWKFAGPGIRSLDLLTDGTSKAELLRIEPGAGAPRHSHGGGEYTLVMAGAFSDESGRYGRGDISVAGPDVTHRPVAEKGAVCFALAVTDAPLDLTGPLGLVQRFLRH
jgi:putative transcriptional regulator